IAIINPTTHVISEMKTGYFLQAIAAGPDGNIWFTEPRVNRIGMINPTTHVISEFSIGLTPNSQPWGITAGPDPKVQARIVVFGEIGRTSCREKVITEVAARTNTNSIPGVAEGRGEHTLRIG